MNGKRGGVLLVLGILWIAFGLSLLNLPQRDYPSEALLWHAAIEPWARAVVWIATGTTSLVFAFQTRDGVGFNALIFMPVIRLCSNLTAFGAWVLDHGYGISTAWSSALLWGAVIALIYTISGWPNPTFSLTEAREINKRYGVGE